LDLNAALHCRLAGRNWNELQPGLPGILRILLEIVVSFLSFILPPTSLEPGCRLTNSTAPLTARYSPVNAPVILKILLREQLGEMVDFNQVGVFKSFLLPKRVQ